MHDGAPPHFLIAVRQLLNSVFLEQSVGPGGPTAWPAPSSDFNTLDFYIWRCLISAVCPTAVSDAQYLQQPIQKEFEMIHSTPGIFQRVWQSLFRLLTPCVEAQDGY